MSNQLLQLEGISDEKAALLIDHFSNFYTIAADWKAKAEAIKVSGTDQVAEMKMARTGRLFLKDKRVAIENLRKKLKEESLREGQAIDRVARELKGLIEPIESYLESQEKYAEIQENIRRSNLRDTRLPALVELGYNTSAGDPADLTEGEYTQLIDSLKAIKAAKMEAERVEQERLERERRELEAPRERERKELAELKAEQDKIRQQNERERAELEKKLAEAKQENDRLEAEKKAAAQTNPPVTPTMYAMPVTRLDSIRFALEVLSGIDGIDGEMFFVGQSGRATIQKMIDQLGDPDLKRILISIEI